MTAAVYAIEIEQGATFYMELKYKDSANAPIDITGYQGRGQLRLSAADTSPLASFTVNIVNAAEGVIGVLLPPEALDDKVFTGKSYADKTRAVYDIELYNSADVIRILNGVANISPNVTKD